MTELPPATTSPPATRRRPAAGPKSAITIARVWGIPIRLHWTFLVLLPVFAYLMGGAYFDQGMGQPPGWVAFAWGGALAVLLFATVALHELAHSFVALRYGVGIRSITLLPIGGVSAMEELPRDPREELRVAAAGPAVNFAIAAPLLALSASGLVPRFSHLPEFVWWSGILNLFIGGFNLLLPAFPMDGGRVLRSLLARRIGRRRATEIAATIGRTFAVLMGIWGFLTLGGGGWLLLLIALFVWIGATEEERSVRIGETLRHLRVADLMTRDVRAVGPEDTVKDVFDEMIRSKHLAYPVVEGLQVQGVVTIHDVARVPPELHAFTFVREVMRPEFPRVSPESGAEDAIRLAAADGPDPLLVLEQGRLEGILTRTDLLRAVQILEAERGDGGRARSAP